MVKFSVYLNRRVFVMKGSTLNGNKFAPRGAFFQLKKIPFQKGDKTV